MSQAMLSFSEWAKNVDDPLLYLGLDLIADQSDAQEPADDRTSYFWTGDIEDDWPWWLDSAVGSGKIELDPHSENKLSAVIHYADSFVVVEPNSGNILFADGELSYEQVHPQAD